MNEDARRFDVCVLGGGIVGRSLALALAGLGLEVALQDAQAAGAAAGMPDVRAYALNAGSVALLERLGVWPALPPDAATPVYDMRILGDAHGARLEFSAYAQRVRELAFIVDTAALEAALLEALQRTPGVVPWSPEAPPPAAALVAIAEGRASAARAALGIEVERHDHGQDAIAARLVSSAPHGGRAWQWFRAPDVLALLPFDRPAPACSYALVWSLPRAQAEHLMALPPPAFEQALAEATGSAAGELTLASPRVAWPLASMRVERWCGEGHVLVGDAAHAVHPLAGQGLNLGLADVDALVRVLAAREPWRPLGDARLLRRYARERAVPTLAMQRLTDGLARLFAHPAPALRELRNRGLSLVDHLPPAKRWLAAQALSSSPTKASSPS